MPLDVPERPSYLRGSMNVNWHTRGLHHPGRRAHARTSSALVPDQLITEDRILEIPSTSDVAMPDPEQDIIKMAVIERHMASGRMGKGFVQGLGLRRGAIASTIAHDHHNLIVAGTDNISLTTAAAAVARHGRRPGGGRRHPHPGAAAAAGGRADDQQAHRRGAPQLDDVIEAARHLGSELHDPFMALSFLALEVIPHLKLTDQGLVDVDQLSLCRCGWSEGQIEYSPKHHLQVVTGVDGRFFAFQAAHREGQREY